jgi:hypothetical protein
MWTYHLKSTERKHYHGFGLGAWDHIATVKEQDGTEVISKDFSNREDAMRFLRDYRVAELKSTLTIPC